MNYFSIEDSKMLYELGCFAPVLEGRHVIWGGLEYVILKITGYDGLLQPFTELVLASDYSRLTRLSDLKIEVASNYDFKRFKPVFALQDFIGCDSYHLANCGMLINTHDKNGDHIMKAGQGGVMRYVEENLQHELLDKEAGQAVDRILTLAIAKSTPTNNG